MAHENLFAAMAGAQDPGGQFAKRLPNGTHIVALTKYNVKNGKKNKNQIIVEADFYVQKSNNPEVKTGDRKGAAWFPNSGKDSFGYGLHRMQQFVQCVADCIGDKRDLTQIGCDLCDDRQPGRGILMQVTVSPSDKIDASGKPYSDFEWTPIPQETLSEDARRLNVRAVLDRIDAAAPQVTALAAPAPVATQPVAAAQPSGFAGFTASPAPAAPAPAAAANPLLAGLSFGQ